MTDQDMPAASADVDNDLDLAADDQTGAVDSGPTDIRNRNILNLPVQIVVSVGKARMTVQELMNLTPESVVELDAKIDDPAEIFVGDRLIARGELVNAEGNDAAIGIRLVQICDSVA